MGLRELFNSMKNQPHEEAMTVSFDRSQISLAVSFARKLTRVIGV